MGAAGFMGGLATLLVLAATAGGAPPTAAMAGVAAWIVGPSMVLVTMSGLLSIAVHAGFHDAGWAWLKAATGVLVLEGGLHVLGPIQEQAKRGGAALAGAADVSAATRLLAAETGTLWVLLAVSAANIALGVWRPRLPSVPVF